MEASIFTLQSPKLDMTHLPVSLEDAVIPIVWAGEVPGHGEVPRKSKRVDPVRIKLKSGAGPVSNTL